MFRNHLRKDLLGKDIPIVKKPYLNDVLSTKFDLEPWRHASCSFNEGWIDRESRERWEQFGYQFVFEFRSGKWMIFDLSSIYRLPPKYPNYPSSSWISKSEVQLNINSKAPSSFTHHFTAELALLPSLDLLYPLLGTYVHSYHLTMNNPLDTSLKQT